MASDNFVDYVKIHCTSGNGGAGSTHFRREKYITKGGPDGGDGGRGGHIIVRGNKQLWTLLPKDIPLDCLPTLPPTLKAPNPKPTRVAEIVGSMYGLKQANNIFDKDFAFTLTSHGYFPIPEDPHTFTKRCPIDPADYLHINTHVDDAQYFSTSKTLTAELKTIILKRYGNDVPFRDV